MCCTWQHDPICVIQAGIDSIKQSISIALRTPRCAVPLQQQLLRDNVQTALGRQRFTPVVGLFSHRPRERAEID